MRPIQSLFVLALLLGLTCTACGQTPLREIIDPAEAAKDPDFKVQGEYVGNGTLGGKKTKVGGQVIALSGGRFDVRLTPGGLPGDGWKRGDQVISLVGQREGNTTALSSADEAFSGKIADGVMTVAARSGKTPLVLKRIERRSPTEGATRPSKSVVLFDGTTADKFPGATMSPDKNLMSNAVSGQKFGDYRLHLEFRLSYMPEARGQARSNSGVYLHDCYEIQVLDSFGLDGKNNECGGFYQIREPDVNMCYPPLQWQTYDVDFTAPRYKDGKKISDARVMVRQNGVVIHPEMQLPHATPGRASEGPAPRPIYLQGHGNKIEYRNIWVVEKK
ncbi:MAG: DUF1080 domain-containing protein [Thermoguttaceae bacterium]